MRPSILPTLLSLALAVTYVVPATGAPTSISTADTQSDPKPNFSPAPATRAICDMTAKHAVSFYVGPQKESVLQAACTGLVTAHNGTLVAAEQKVSANIEDLDTGNKVPYYSLQFSVFPPGNTSEAKGKWEYQTCYDYLDYFVSNDPPKGCKNWIGSGMGKIILGEVAGNAKMSGLCLEMAVVRDRD